MSFIEVCPHHLNLFHCTTVPSYSQLITREPICYFDITYPSNHSHLSHWSIISFSFFTGRASL